MNMLESERVKQTLLRLHREAEETDRQLMETFYAPDAEPERIVNDLIDAEKRDLGEVYSRLSGNYLSVSPEFGRFFYASARARKARRIVEFGTSMGVSTIYMAAALRDNGGGRLIGAELEPGKAVRARANLAAAGPADLVEVRVGTRGTRCGRSKVKLTW